MMRRVTVALLLGGLAGSAWADPISLIAIGAAAGFTGTAALVVGAVISYGGYVAMAASVYGSIEARRKARMAAAQAKAAYNASLSDRFVTALRADPPLRGIYGRAVVGGDIVAMFTSDATGYRTDGSTYVKPDGLKHLVVVFAAHRCQRLVEVMIGGVPVKIGALDANGWVTTGDFAVPMQVHRELEIAPGGSWTAPTPLTVLSALVTLSGDGGTAPGAYVVTGAGKVLTNTSTTDTLTASVTYADVAPAVRVSWHLGAPDQLADPYLMSVVPAQWTADDRLRGLSYAVISLAQEFPQFQSGPPDLTFDVLGALVYDPRRNRSPVAMLEGAVAGTPGTLPTGVSLGIAAGMAQQVVGSGVDAETGLNYLDLRIFGTSTATATMPLLLGSAGVAPAAAPGQAWAARCRLRFLVLTNAHTFVRMQLVSFDAGNAGTVESGGASVVISVAAGTQDASASDAALAAAAAKVSSRLAFGLAAGVSYDTTVRVMLPQLWPGRLNVGDPLDLGTGDPISWSENNALCTRDYVVSPLGMTAAWQDVDDDAVMVAANACDAGGVFTQDGASFGGATYTANGAFTTDDGRDVVLQQLCESMAGYAVPGAKWVIQAGAWTVPVMTLTDDHLAGPVEIVQAGAGMDDLFNGVRASYVPAGTSVQADIVYQVPAFVSADGEELWTDLSLPWTDGAARAANLCRVFAERSRSGLVVRYVAKLHAWPLQVGDRVWVYNAEHAWVAKVFRVTDWEPSGITVVLTLQEDGASIYDFADAQVSDPTPNTALPSPWQVSALTGVDVTSGAGHWLINGDGTLNVRALVSWSPPADAYIAMPGGSIEIAWRRAAIDPPNQWTLITTPGDGVKEWINGLEHGQVITVGVTPINGLGYRGPTQWVSRVVQGKTSSPSDVAGLNYAMEAGGARLRWQRVADLDVSRYEIRKGGATWEAATYVARVQGDDYLLTNLWSATTVAWVKAVDSSGNLSAIAASVTVTGSTARPYRVVAQGASDTAGPPRGLRDQRDGSMILAGGRSFNMARIRRAPPYDVTFSATYDVYGVGAIGGKTAATLAADLNASGSDVVVVVWTWDEPRDNRLTAGLAAAMYRCGASQGVFGSPQFKFRGAYVLVGIPGCGEGAGAEAYNGDTDSSTNAWCDLAFAVGPGGLEVTGTTSTPRTLRDYSYSGDLNASAGTVLIGRGACTVAGSTVVGSSNGVWGGADCYSADAYTGGAFASAVVGQADQSVAFGLNSDPLADRHYSSIDYAINAGNDGQVYAVESGVSSPALGSYATGDVLALAYDGASVCYLRNGQVLRKVSAAPDQRLYFDSAFLQSGVLSSVQFGPLSAVTGIGTSQLASSAATDVVSTSVASDTWLFTAPSSGFVARTLAATTYLNSGSTAIVLEISAFANRTLHSDGAGAINAVSLLGYNVNGGGYVSAASWIEDRQVASSSADARWSEGVTATYSLAAGASITVALITQVAGLVVQTGKLTTTGAMVRVTGVKR